MITLNQLQKSYLYFLVALVVCIFILLHTNQNSSQTLATFFLAFSPLLLLLKNPSAVNKDYKLISFSVIAYITYFLLQYFQRENSDIAYGAARNLLFILLLPITILLVINLKPSKQQIFYLILIASILSISPIFSDLLQHKSRGNSVTHPIFWGNIALCTGLICFVFGHHLPNREKYLSYIGLTFGLAASIWSGTRGGWISLPVVMLFLVWSKSIYYKKIIILTLAICIAISLYPPARQRVIKTFTPPTSAQISAANEDLAINSDNSTNARLAMWKIAFDTFLKSPIIGTGLDGFYSAGDEAIEDKTTSNRNIRYKHAHNDVLEILSSGGILGLMAYIGIFLSIMRVFISTVKNPNLMPYSFSGILLTLEFLIFGVTETFMLSKLTVVYFSLIGGIMAGSIISEKYGNRKNA